MARAGLNRDVVVALALALVDEGGPTGFADLGLAKVAARAGVATPSLYKHVDSLADLRREVAVAAVEDLTRVATSATVGRAGPDAVRSLAHALRGFARRHPGRYVAAQIAPDPDDPADAPLGAVAARSVEVVTATLRGFGLRPGREVDAVRSVRASLHGFVLLELGGGYRLPDDLDASFEAHVDMIVAGLASLAHGA